MILEKMLIFLLRNLKFMAIRSKTDQVFEAGSNILYLCKTLGDKQQSENPLMRVSNAY
jgi:hypothetical protein